MLRNIVGDDAFFKSLNKYLTNNKFKTGEAAQLRLAFEEVTGRDLNWFWNQWYYGSGHPKLKISYNYDSTGYSGVIINQTQKSGKAFVLPMAVDIYINGNKTRNQITTTSLNDTFYFKTSQKPEWISVDADKILLAEKTDNKSEENYQAQWKYGKNYLDRKEALDYFAKNNISTLKEGLNDKFFKLRISTIQKLSSSSLKSDEGVLTSVEEIAKNDKNRKAKAAAINFLVKNGDKKYIPIFQTAINDSSYAVAGAAFKGLVAQDAEASYELAKKYSTDAKGVLGDEVIKILISKGKEEDFEYIARAFADAPLTQEKLQLSDKFAEFLVKLNDINNIKKGIDYMLELRNQIPANFRSFTDAGFKKNFDKISKAKGKEVEDYVSERFK